MKNKILFSDKININAMPMAVRILLLIFASLYIFFHFYTLPLNPLPWIDEVFFASISKAFAETGNLTPMVSYEFWKDEVLLYGPVHFFIASTSFKLFGFGMIQYRCITLVFGILTIIATANLFRLSNLSVRAVVLFIVCFAFDPFNNLSMHEGRMDLEVIFFMILSIQFLLRAFENENPVYFISSGVFATLSLLTSPRIGFVYLVLFFVFLFKLEGKEIKKSGILLLYWLAPFLLLYSVWIFYAFGGYIETYHYYQNLRTENGEYLYGRFYIPRHEYLLIFLTLVSVGFGIYKMKKVYFNTLTIISILSIISFYSIVLDWGPYSVLILPFYYYLLFHGFASSQLSLKTVSTYPLLLLLVYNLFFFSIKSVQTISEKEMRNPKVADDFIQKNIPKGSKVVGDPQYYYAVINAGSDYRCFDEFMEDAQREQILREVYNYDYLILSPRAIQKNKKLAELFLKNSTFKLVDELAMQPSELSKKINSLGIVSNVERFGYNAAIFVRIKENILPLAYSKID